MTITRRKLFKASLAAGAACSMPAILRAQTAPTAARTARMVLAYPLVAYDPVFTTSDTTQDHAFAIYDTLFALDSNQVPQPQMVGNWGLSSDKKTYKFELRDGLAWHDGSRVTAADCVASIRRWAQRSPSGRVMMDRARDISRTDDKTFAITLKEPLGILIDILATQAGSPLFIMREKDANRSPTEQVIENIGSGPFKFNGALARPGSSFTYDRNANYVPRKEPPSGSAGAKEVKVDRIVWDIMPDQQTAMGALQAGEIDFIENPPVDLFPAIESDPNLALQVLNTAGSIWFLRMNFLQKPFDNVKARRAMLHLIDQEAFMRAAVGNPKFTGPNTSMFGAVSIYANDENTGWYTKNGDPEAAKRLFREAGYSGEKVVIITSNSNSISPLLTQTLQKIGVNAELAMSDRAGIVKRRANKGPVQDGGWNIFMGPWGAGDFDDPIGCDLLVANGEKAWIGWPKDDTFESLRNKWPETNSPEERKALARQMQKAWWDFVGMVYLGRSMLPAAHRKSLSGLIPDPTTYIKMWNMQKV
ncbi:ABC transporter substrate-binding protein [Bradyrhizobium sp. CCGB12]|uniref:ABC transporter substrate-binding protein n=1 Tax=Bradyrhizobium sp. CCGB12 TaxID=2949632 RepID=UPI0020B1B385|nr:ABC transporter substrate-binding protein [Bradyrhizobium sp. CCGB12]MCP3392263.1 ABC transporter substrate-binding protein [Bradyrhizobium sp. CCGB12]